MSRHASLAPPSWWRGFPPSPWAPLGSGMSTCIPWQLVRHQTHWEMVQNCSQLLSSQYASLKKIQFTEQYSAIPSDSNNTEISFKEVYSFQSTDHWLFFWRLPIFQGPAVTYAVPLFALANLPEWQCPSQKDLGQCENTNCFPFSLHYLHFKPFFPQLFFRSFLGSCCGGFLLV